MEGEGGEVEDGEDRGQMMLAVAEIVLEVVALGFHRIEAFVLDFPARSATSCQFDDIVAGDRQVGEEAVSIGPRAGGIAAFDHHPIHPPPLPTAPHRPTSPPSICLT